VKECESSLSPGHCDHLVFSQDGRTVAFLWHDTFTSFSLFVWDAIAGRELLHLDLGIGAYGHIDLAPDGSRVAVTTVAGLEKYGWCNSTVRVFETATGREIFSRRGLRTESTFWPAWSPDGRWIALNPGSSVDGDSRIILLDSRTGDEKAALKLGAQKLTSLAVSRDGRYLAATRSEGETKTVLAWEAGRILLGESPDPFVTLTGHGGEVNHYEFSPDGRRVLTSGAGVVKLWDAATGREVLALKAKGHVVRDAFFSPDGHSIWAGLDENGQLWGWDGTPLAEGRKP
jgi:WD40 repeat protein